MIFGIIRILSLMRFLVGGKGDETMVREIRSKLKGHVARRTAVF